MQEIKQVTDEEVEMILIDLWEGYGYNFTGYSRAALKRRVNRLFALDKFPGFAEFRYRIRNDPAYFRRFVEGITVNVTEMFSDPGFYRTIRQEVLPVLATHPFIKVWHAGCSTGEEAYSMAILLEEANLLHRSLIYATDINPGVLESAGKGIFPLSQMKQYSENYILSGGKNDFSQYYSARYGLARFEERLNKNMIMSPHNLVSDHSFDEFQLIFCRNVLIYFNRELQDSVLHLFDESLERLGFLALGSKESLRFTSVSNKFRQLDNKEKIWQKIG